VVDRQFAEASLAQLYDLWSPWERRADFRFYLPRVMNAASVLDVGCGTGELLRLARSARHNGRLCGLDPGEGMLAQARRRADIEWVRGHAADAAWQREFDLVVMSGHAFQVFVTDDEIRSALRAISAALSPGGRFAFETRHPLARAWERWTPASAIEVSGQDGSVVRMAHEVDAPFDGRTVSFTTTYSSPAWDRPEVSYSTLRFVSQDELQAFLAGAGLTVREQFGDWDRQPLTEASPEIITIAGLASNAEAE